MARRMKLGCNFVRYVSAGSSTAAFTRRETAMASLATRSYCTSAGPTSSRPAGITEKIVDFVVGIAVPIILPCSVIYWWDGKKERPFFHEKVAELKERFGQLRKDHARDQQAYDPMIRQEVEELETQIEKERKDAERLQALLESKWQEIGKRQDLLQERRNAEKISACTEKMRKEIAELKAELEQERVKYEAMKQSLVNVAELAGSKPKQPRA